VSTTAAERIVSVVEAGTDRGALIDAIDEIARTFGWVTAPVKDLVAELLEKEGVPADTWEAERFLVELATRSPVKADRAAVGILYLWMPYPDPVVIIDWGAVGQTCAVIYDDGSLLDEHTNPWSNWVDWIDTQIEPVTFIVTARGDAELAQQVRDTLRRAGHEVHEVHEVLE
jgi:hypothetical protein